jgi:hypothetical protein
MILVAYVLIFLMVGVYYHVDLFIYDIIDLWKLHGFKFAYGCFKGRHRAYWGWL